MLSLGHQCQRNRSTILLRALGGAESAKACQGRKDHGFPAAYAWEGQRQEDPWIYSGPYKHLPYVSGKTLAPLGFRAIGISLMESFWRPLVLKSIFLHWTPLPPGGPSRP